MITRRTILKTVLKGTTALTTGAIFIGLPSWSRASSRMTNRLRIPEQLKGTLKDGVRHYDLTVQKGSMPFLTGLTTPTLGINGDFLGPLLRLRDGENVALNVTNQIGESSTLHWHGMHVPAHADGGPHQLIENEKTWQAAFKVKQKAATFWYHAHLMHKTGPQVYRGLAGMMIVEDEESRRLDLPSTYGVDDIPLILQDRAFNRDGSFRYITHMHDIMAGMRGETILVNGTASPFMPVTTRKVRFRVLNGSNARFYQIGFSDRRRFHQIATDGSFLRQPLETDRVTIAPGERVEIVADFNVAKPVKLVHIPIVPQTGGMRGGMGRGMGRGMGMMESFDSQPLDLLEVRPEKSLKAASPLPAKLTDVPNFREQDAVKTRRFVLDMRMGPGMMRGGGSGERFTINGRAMDMNRIDETVKLGDTEIWEIKNDSPMAHPFHIHDIQFRILDRNGKQPGPEEQGLKDTVRVHGGETVRIITRFEDYADPKLPYMYHCHILEHEDAGMMGQFVVTA